MADDTNTAAPMLVALSVNGNAATVTSGPTSVSSPTTAGTLVDGVLVGQTWQWTVAFKASPTQLNLTLTLIIQTHDGHTGNYTLKNEWIFAPTVPEAVRTPLDRTNAAQTDQNILKWLKVGSKGAASLRFMGLNLNSSAQSQQLLSVRHSQSERLCVGRHQDHHHG